VSFAAPVKTSGAWKIFSPGDKGETCIQRARYSGKTGAVAFLAAPFVYTWDGHGETPAARAKFTADCSK
jgi:hypothetical protein